MAQKVTQFLTETNRYDKTIIFCEDLDHAERMRHALVYANLNLCAQNRLTVPATSASSVTSSDGSVTGR